MKVAIFIATSINGLITKADFDSDWVNDWDTFTTIIKEYGCVVMGRKTYEASLEVSPFPAAQNVVLTSNTEISNDKVIFLNLSPAEALSVLNKRGFDKLLLIGGQYTITEFLKAGLVDEIYLDVHPLYIGRGKSISQSIDNLDLTLIDTKTSEQGIVTLHYKINKI
ncbi:MAG: dihydrofolate reductase family protein [Microgenomates group bacterium]